MLKETNRPNKFHFILMLFPFGVYRGTAESHDTSISRFLNKPRILHNGCKITFLLNMYEHSLFSAPASTFIFHLLLIVMVTGTRRGHMMILICICLIFKNVNPVFQTLLWLFLTPFEWCYSVAFKLG